MHLVKRSRLRCAIGMALALVVATHPATAQTSTTGTLSGTVVDQQGAVMPGVTVTATASSLFAGPLNTPRTGGTSL